MSGRKTKAKPPRQARKLRPVVRRLSNWGKLCSQIDEARILQLSNDLSENMASGTLKDWRKVAWYWRNQFDRVSRSHDDIRQSVAALCIGSKMIIEGRREMDKWLDALKPNARREFPAASAGKLDGVVGSLDSET